MNEKIHDQQDHRHRYNDNEKSPSGACQFHRSKDYGYSPWTQEERAIMFEAAYDFMHLCRNDQVRSLMLKLPHHCFHSIQRVLDTIRKKHKIFHEYGTPYEKEGKEQQIMDMKKPRKYTHWLKAENAIIIEHLRNFDFPDTKSQVNYMQKFIPNRKKHEIRIKLRDTRVRQKIKEDYWSTDQIELLLEAYKKCGPNWTFISEKILEDKSIESCQQQYNKIVRKNELNDLSKNVLENLKQLQVCFENNLNNFNFQDLNDINDQVLKLSNEVSAFQEGAQELKIKVQQSWMSDNIIKFQHVNDLNIINNCLRRFLH